MVGQVLIVHGELQVKNRDPRLIQTGTSPSQSMSEAC